MHLPLLTTTLLALALTPLATPTLVYPNTAPHCGNRAGAIGSFSDCGDTTLRNYNVRSAQVLYYQKTVRFFRNADCTGTRISIASSECVDFPFRPLCARVLC